MTDHGGKPLSDQKLSLPKLLCILVFLGGCLIGIPWIAIDILRGILYPDSRWDYWGEAFMLMAIIAVFLNIVEKWQDRADK